MGANWKDRLVAPSSRIRACRSPRRTDRIEVEWDGEYEPLGDFFSVHTGHPEIGERAISGYPLDNICKVLETVDSTLSKMTDVIGQWDVVDITDEAVARFVSKGWTEKGVLELKAEGYRYSPNRDTLLGPVMSSSYLGDEDDVEDPRAKRARAARSAGPRQREAATESLLAMTVPMMLSSSPSRRKSEEGESDRVGD